MKNINLSTPIILVILVIVLAVGYFWGKYSISRYPTNYIFDTKTLSYYKSGDFEYVNVSGTLTGDGRKNNTTSIACYKDKMECLVSNIQGISETSCQPRLATPQSFTVVKWDDYIITATDISPYHRFSCYKNTINIDRKTQVTEWVKEPINQSSLNCIDSHDNKIYKWTIEDPQWMKDYMDGLGYPSN